MSVLTAPEVNDLDGRVVGNGIARESYILFSIERLVLLFGLKTLERCCLNVSAFSLSLMAKILSAFLIRKERLF